MMHATRHAVRRSWRRAPRALAWSRRRCSRCVVAPRGVRRAAHARAGGGARRARAARCSSWRRSSSALALARARSGRGARALGARGSRCATMVGCACADRAVRRRPRASSACARRSAARSRRSPPATRSARAFGRLHGVSVAWLGARLRRRRRRRLARSQPSARRSTPRTASRQSDFDHHRPPMADAFRSEKDPLGPLDVPADALYGVQTMRARRTSRSAACKPLWPFVQSQVWIKKAAALTHKETGRLDAKMADAIVAGRGRGARAQARRALRRRPVPGGRRHVAQHERERGAGEPRQRAARRQARRVRARASERPREHGAVDQRHDPHEHPAVRAVAAAGAGDGVRGAARRAGGEGARVRPHREGRAARTCRTRCPSGSDRSSPRTRARSTARCAACKEAADYLRDLGIGGSAVGTGVTVEPEYPALMNKHLKAITGARAARRRRIASSSCRAWATRPRSAHRCAGSRSTCRRSRATCASW